MRILYEASFVMLICWIFSEISVDKSVVCNTSIALSIFSATFSIVMRLIGWVSNIYKSICIMGDFIG